MDIESWHVWQTEIFFEKKKKAARSFTGFAVVFF